MTLATYALVTLANTKTFLGISTSDKDDLIEMLINMATDYIESEIGIRFKSTVYTNEEYDGTGRSELKLKHFPVIIPPTVFLQKNNATDNTDSWEDISADDFWVDQETGIITRTSSFLDFEDNANNDEGLTDDAKFTLGKNKYRVTYTAGYATVPYDIQYACMTMVGDTLNTRNKGGIKSETLGDHSVTMADANAENKVVNAILDKYRDQPLA